MRKVLAGALAGVALSWAQGVPAADAAKERREAAGATKAEAKQKAHPLFEGKKNFDVNGKVAEVSPNAITIQRDELPSAKLHVSKDTKVEVDGKKSSVQELKRGQDVKASFNLQGDKVEAVEIKADKLGKDDRKEMTEQKRENQKEQQKQQQKKQ